MVAQVYEQDPAMVAHAVDPAGQADGRTDIGGAQFGAPGIKGLVMSVSVPLGSRPRAAYAVAEADAQLDALAARREADRLESCGRTLHDLAPERVVVKLPVPARAMGSRSWSAR